MKYVYLILGGICVLMMLIIFFQSIIRAQTPVPFLSQTRGITLSTFVMTSFAISFLGGVFLTLGIKGLFNNYTDTND
jgi:hypothetical protein